MTPSVAMRSELELIRPLAWAGVLVPPANPTIEPELHRLVTPAMTLFAARFPTMPGTTLEQRNRRYIALYRDAVRSFGELRLAAIVIGLTGPSYRLGCKGDLALTEELTAHADGIPVETASRAIALALTEIGARRLCLVSPYPLWLTQEAVTYWREGGYDIVQVVKIAETSRAYDLTNDDVTAALATVKHDAIDATIMSGTGMLTLPAILTARESGVATPILSSNLCCAWWLLRTAAQARGSASFERAAPELAAHLRSSIHAPKALERIHREPDDPSP